MVNDDDPELEADPKPDAEVDAVPVLDWDGQTASEEVVQAAKGAPPAHTEQGAHEEAPGPELKLTPGVHDVQLLAPRGSWL